MRSARPVTQLSHGLDMAPMTGDPYCYEGSDVLTNLFGMRDAADLAEAERQATAPRINALCIVHPVLTAPAYLALHGAIFAPVYEWAGQVRTVPLALDGAAFARPAMILPSLAARFAKLSKADGFAGLPRDAFCDSLAHHISEVHAILPFRAGNRRTLAVHSAQLARAAGHRLEACINDKTIWDDALAHSFVTNDHRRISDALLGRAEPQIDMSSPSGLPLLPPRDATVHRRYVITSAKAGRLLREHIAAATMQAADALAHLAKANAPQDMISVARQELDFLRHPKGPLFQLAVLGDLGIGKILAVIHDAQSPLETVREIAAAVLIALSEHSPSAIVQAGLAVGHPGYPIGGSPHQSRLAAEFLANSPQDNLADPRFVSAQRLIDRAATDASRSSGGNIKYINAATAKARADIAARIGDGVAFEIGAVARPRHSRAGGNP
jgi:cell filamentation protein